MKHNQDDMLPLNELIVWLSKEIKKRSEIDVCLASYTEICQEEILRTIKRKANKILKKHRMKGMAKINIKRTKKTR